MDDAAIVLSSGDEDVKGHKKEKKKKDKKHKKDKGQNDKQSKHDTPETSNKTDATPEKKLGGVVSKNPLQDVSLPKENERVDNNGKPIPLAPSTMYSEDTFEDGHTSVWGSIWEAPAEGGSSGRWGYACCRGFSRHQRCPYAPKDECAAEEEAIIDTMTCETGLKRWEASMMKDKMDDDMMDKDTRAARKKRRLQEWQQIFFETELEEFRQAAAKINASDYGAEVELSEKLKDIGAPLRMFTRRKDVAWEWAGEFQPLIGGNDGESADVW